MSAERDERSVVLLNGTFNHSSDIQGLLSLVRPRVSDTARLVAVIYNPYFAWIYLLAQKLGLRSGEPPTTFVTVTDLTNLARLSGFRVVRMRSAVYVPFKLLGIGSLINAFMPAVPLLRHLAFSVIVVLAPIANRKKARRLSVVVPARNERGNIQPALEGLRKAAGYFTNLEVVLVEGNSTDDTWNEIQRLAPKYEKFFKLVTLQQQGRGKGDAVRLGFSKASGDLLTILDADLTVPPDRLARFYEAYIQGHGEFINGSRLVYGSDSQAMRFLNRIGNVVFAKLLSYVLSIRIGDSLCGTKLVSRDDYARFTKWRQRFGDFDPFGDFELLFPAAVLGLNVIDVPIRYEARSYGETNISRFRHGWMLLKMTIVGFFRIRLGQV
jgi:hypothetical protein